MGSRTDLSEFIRREHPRLVGALTAHCGDRALAEDLAQEALARACDRWGEVAAMAAPGAWVYRVALNLSSSWFRRRRAERRATRRHDRIEAVSDPDVVEVVAVRRAIMGLAVKQRTALVCRFYLDLSAAQTAQVMGVSEAAARQHVSRAVKTLRGHCDMPRPEGERRHV